MQSHSTKITALNSTRCAREHSMINGWDQFKRLHFSLAFDSEAPRRHLFNKELALEIEFSINRQQQEIETAVDMSRDGSVPDRTVLLTRSSEFSFGQDMLHVLKAIIVWKWDCLYLKTFKNCSNLTFTVLCIIFRLESSILCTQHSRSSTECLKSLVGELRLLLYKKLT